MARLAERTLREELGKHFAGTADARVEAALRLGEQALDLFQATLPPGTTRQQARAMMQRNRHPGRRRARLADPSDA
jgi:hypothetical protein